MTLLQKSVGIMLLAIAAVLSASGVASAATCSQAYSPSVAIPTGYGAAYDVFSSGTMLVTGDCTGATPKLVVGGTNQSQYIYKIGYAYKGGSWQQVSLQGSGALIASNWYAGSAQGNLPFTSADLSSNWNYIVGYVCTWSGSAWKCGCADTTCSTGNWQLQAILTPGTGPTPTGQCGSTDWYTYGHDGQHTFASDGCISGPLTKSWSFTPTSPNGGNLKEVEHAIATSHGIYVKSFNWNSGAQASAMVDKLDASGNTQWRWTFGDLEEHSWPTFALGKLLVEEDSFWLIDDNNGNATQMASYDDWGVNTSDGKRFYSSSNVNSRDTNVGLYVGAWSASASAGWPPWIWGQQQYAAPQCGYKIRDSIAVDNQVVFNAGEYVANSGQIPPFANGMYSYDGTSGTQRWQQNTTPRSVLSAGGGKVFMMEQSGGGTALVARNQSDGTVAWSVPMAGSPSVQAPVIAGSIVIVAGSDGVTAFNANSGTQAWKANGVLAAQQEFVGDPQLSLDPCGGTDTIHAFADTSLAAALGSGTLVVTARDGVHVLKLADGSQVWSGQIPGTTGPLKNPVIVGKTLYAVDTGANGGLGALVNATSP